VFGKEKSLHQSYSGKKIKGLGSVLGKKYSWGERTAIY